MEVTVAFYALPAGIDQLAFDLLALIVIMGICSHARNPRIYVWSVDIYDVLLFTPMTILVATKNFQHAATLNFTAVMSC